MLSTVLAIAAAIVAVAAFAGAFWAKFRTSADETTIQVWKGEAEAQKARADRLDAETKELRHLITQLTVRVEKVEAENATLRSLQNHRDEIAALRDDIRNLPCQLIQKKE